MGLKKIHHIGIAVDNFQQAIEKFKGFGLSCSDIKDMEGAGVKIAFFPVGDVLIELLHFEPFKGSGDVIRSQKGAINHICFEVADLDAGIQDFEKNGAKLLDGFPITGDHGRMAFFHPDTTENVLIEILQE